MKYLDGVASLDKVKQHVASEVTKVLRSLRSDRRMTDERVPRIRSTTRERINYEAIHSENVLQRTLGRFQLAFDSIFADHLTPRLVGRTTLTFDCVGTSEVGPDIKDPPANYHGLRTLGGSGDSNAAAKANHNHSIAFKQLPREERLHFIELRRRFRESEESETLRGQLFLALLHMQMDDEDLTADERERRFDDPGWVGWSAAYKKQHFIDEHKNVHNYEWDGEVSELNAKYMSLAEAEERLKSGDFFRTPGGDGKAGYVEWAGCYLVAMARGGGVQPVAAADINELYSRMEGWGLPLEAWGLVDDPSEALESA